MPRILSARVILYLVLLLALDLGVAPVLRVFDCRPVFLYLMIPYAALEWGWERTISIALVIGVLRDLVSSSAFGLETCSLVIAATVLDALVQKVERQSPVIRFVFGFLFVLLVFLLEMILSAILGISGPLSAGVIGMALAAAFYTALMMPFFFFLTASWFRDRTTSFRQYELFR